MEKKIKNNEPIRLNVFLQEHGVASRRKADEMILAGMVSVNGELIRKLGSKVEKTDEVSVNGKKVSRKPAKSIYLFHKPYLTITSRNDEQSRSTIFDLPALKKLPANVQPVGRLDFKSEGLLILTNDGDLALALSHPKYSVSKTYSVLLSTQITKDEITKLKNGIQLEDGLAKPLFVKLLSKEKFANSTGQWVEIAVTEGRNRLVRRMMEALGLKVVRLIRVSIGNIRLPSNLQPGKIRLTTDAEKIYLDELKKTINPNPITKNKTKLKLPKQEIVDKSRERRKKTLTNEEYAQEVTNRHKKIQQISRERKKATIK